MIPSATLSTRNPKLTKLDWLIMALFLLAIFWMNLPLSKVQYYSADACEYLEAGKNLFSGKGFMITFNRYQAWTSTSIPWFPYSVPIYPLLAGWLFQWNGVQSVIWGNMFLWSLNCVLIYLILRTTLSTLGAALIVGAVAFSVTGTYSSLVPWTEQLHLFLLLLSFLIYLKDEKKYWITGLLLIIGCFVRFAGIFNVFAFVLTLLITEKKPDQAFRKVMNVALLALLIFGIYECVSLVCYGAWWPQYPSLGKTYTWAQMFEGAVYQDGGPTIKLPELQIPVALIIKNLLHHFGILLATFDRTLFIIIIGCFFPVYKIIQREDRFWATLWFQGAVAFLAYPFSLWWFPHFEGDRYGLISFIMFFILGFSSIQIFLGHWKRQQFQNLVFVVFMAAIIYGSRNYYLGFTQAYREIYLKISPTFVEDRTLMAEWVQRNTAPEALIATEFDQDSFVLNRPAILFPSGQMRTQKKFKDFLRIFRPQYCLVNNLELIDFLKDEGFKENFRQGVFTVLGK